MDRKKPFWVPWPIRVPHNMRHGLVEASEYRRTKNLVLECTQLSGPASDKRRILHEWCEFLKQPLPARVLVVATRCPQELFEAVCHQKELTALGIKSGPIADLSPISKLTKIERLDLGSCSVTDLKPIAKLKRLQHLSLENLDRLSDYSTVGKLKELLYLRIEGATFMPKKVSIDDLKFLKTLKNLRGLSITCARFRNLDFAKAFKRLNNLEYLSLSMVDEDTRISLSESLPNLKYGNVPQPRPLIR